MKRKRGNTDTTTGASGSGTHLFLPTRRVQYPTYEDIGYTGSHRWDPAAQPTRSSFHGGAPSFHGGAPRPPFDDTKGKRRVQRVSWNTAHVDMYRHNPGWKNPETVRHNVPIRPRIQTARYRESKRRLGAERSSRPSLGDLGHTRTQYLANFQRVVESEGLDVPDTTTLDPFYESIRKRYDARERLLQKLYRQATKGQEYTENLRRYASFKNILLRDDRAVRELAPMLFRGDLLNNLREAYGLKRRNKA